MKLITKELIERFQEVGDQSELENPLFIAKFFNPCGSETWYASEYDSTQNICFGYVTGMFMDEWGSFSIDELEGIKLPFGMRIERDIYFDEMPFWKLIKKDRQGELLKEKKKEIDREMER